MSPAGRKPVTAETRRKRGETDRAMPVVIGGRIAPPMPHGLNGREQTCWRYIVADLMKADAIDHADAGIIEAAAVHWALARQARTERHLVGLYDESRQGKVVGRALSIELLAWKEFRALAESLPLSPWGRARLGLKGAALDEPVGQTIGPSPRRLRAVGNDG
jgi:phage terminase small subunit